MSSEDMRALGEYVTLTRGTTYKGELVGKPGPALLGLGSIIPGGGFRETDFKTYGGECPEKLILSPGELFAALKGATKDGKMIGSVARVPSWVPSGRLTQDTVHLRFIRRESVAKNYVYWLLQTPHYRDYCAGRATGSAVVALSRSDFLSYPVPELTGERRQLVDVLESIEERVRLLGETNATLEAIAQALFKSWFVDFDPVRAKIDHRMPEGMDEATAALLPTSFEESDLGLIPSGWHVGLLGTVSQTARKQVGVTQLTGDLQYVGLEHMPRKSLSLFEWGTASGLESAKAAFSAGDILFGKLRPYFHKVVIAPVDGVCSTDILVCQAAQPAYYGFVAMHLSSTELINYADRLSNGAKMPRVSWADLSAYPVAVPPPSVASAYTQVITPVFERMAANVHLMRTLANLRDTLLPRLISGKLRLPEAESLVSDAAAT